MIEADLADPRLCVAVGGAGTVVGVSLLAAGVAVGGVVSTAAGAAFAALALGLKQRGERR